MRSSARLAMLAAVSLALVACGGGYQLRGKVISGQATSVSVVDEHDPRLDEPGLAGASIRAVLDPREMSQKPLPAATTAGDGTFEVPVREPGAGLLKYTVQVMGGRSGYQTAADTFPLPGGDKRVLITLSPGRDAFRGQTPGGPGAPGQADQFLEETLRMSEPYMKE